MEKADIIYPICAQEEYQQAGLTPLLDSTLPSLLKKTEDSLHALDFEKAVKFYHLFTIQSESSFYKKEKARVASERIKKKMALLTKQTLLQYAMEKKEFVNVHQILNEIADLYNELLPESSEKEMLLLDHIKSFHTEYSTVLLQRNKR